MPKFKVTVTADLVVEIEVEAEDAEQALELVNKVGVTSQELLDGIRNMETEVAA